ncbi:MAG: hypothetical protein NW223_17535 [Hyphomicrobiaceae bacterium]|nr:hypothetical protein [Hyphomicrobiaceae bacterium]
MTTTRAALGLTAVLMLAGTGIAAAAPECKEEFVGRFKAIDPSSPKDSERTAIDGAIAHWRQQVRHAYGWPYRYWTSARNRKVRCTGTAGGRACAVSARPCRRET